MERDLTCCCATLQVKAERHAGDDSVEELQAHSIKKVRVLHDGEADDSGEEQPKNVPERAKR